MFNNQDVKWTDAAVAKLKAKWADGWSHSQIAALIPNATRSAIAGKIMRLKLPARDKGHVRGFPRATRTPPPATAPKPKPGKFAAISQVPTVGRRNPSNSLAEKLAIAEAEPGLSEKYRGEEPDGTGVKLIGLSDLNCHFPKGDPRSDDFEFCGAPAIAGRPYCAHHCRIAYAPPVRRRDAEQLKPKLASAHVNNFYQR